MLVKSALVFVISFMVAHPVLAEEIFEISESDTQAMVESLRSHALWMDVLNDKNQDPRRRRARRERIAKMAIIANRAPEAHYPGAGVRVKARMRKVGFEAVHAWAGASLPTETYKRLAIVVEKQLKTKYDDIVIHIRILRAVPNVVKLLESQDLDSDEEK